MVLCVSAVSFWTGCASAPAPSSGPVAAKARAPSPAAEEEAETPPFETRIARLRLGMSKARVAAIMGDEGHSAHRGLSAQGNTETVVYTPDFGQRYSTALRRQFSLGFAGMSDPNGSVLTFRNGALLSISSQ